MPHVIVKLHEGRSETEKQALADEVTHAIVAALGCPEEIVSVSIEDVSPERWLEDVYKPDILEGNDKIYKKPGYDPLQ